MKSKKPVIDLTPAPIPRYGEKWQPTLECQDVISRKDGYVKRQNMTGFGMMVLGESGPPACTSIDQGQERIPVSIYSWSLSGIFPN